MKILASREPQPPTTLVLSYPVVRMETALRNTYAPALGGVARRFAVLKPNLITARLLLTLRLLR